MFHFCVRSRIKSQRVTFSVLPVYVYPFKGQCYFGNVCVKRRRGDQKTQAWTIRLVRKASRAQKAKGRHQNTLLISENSIYQKPQGIRKWSASISSNNIRASENADRGIRKHRYSYDFLGAPYLRAPSL